MSLHPHATYVVPEETQRVARAAFPRGNIYMQVADRLGLIYHDTQFAALFSPHGQKPQRISPCVVWTAPFGLPNWLVSANV